MHMARNAEDEPDYLRELLAQAGIDAQASSVAAKLQEIIIGELHHRVKNTLAIVSAITSQSLKTANSLEEATRTIADRLHALGVAQDLLVRERWTAAGCRTLIEGAVKAFQSKGLDQFEIAGDNIAISSGLLSPSQWSFTNSAPMPLNTARCLYLAVTFQFHGLSSRAITCSVLGCIGRKLVGRRSTNLLERASDLGSLNRRSPVNCKGKLDLGLNPMA
jgi:hypothetical protein